MDTRYLMGFAAVLLVVGLGVFILAAKASPAGYLILLCCLIAAVGLAMVALMRRNNPPHARP